MKNKIEVTIKTVYGSTRYLAYPENKEARFLTSFIGQKTLTIKNLILLEGMGYLISSSTIPWSVVKESVSNSDSKAAKGEAQ